VSTATAGTAEEGARASRAAPVTPAVPAPLIRHLGRVDYETTWRTMQNFTDTRDRESADEIWFLEHAPIFTLGMNASRAHLIAPGDIPVLQIDRGGQVTYHGPGQLVVYPLIDLKRAGLGVRALVSALEESVVSYAAELGIQAHSRRNAPGVYVADRKLASLGIRIRRGASYHGLALNVDMDLEPFERIHPCGYVGLQMTQLADLGGPSCIETVAQKFAPHLLRALFANGEVTRTGI
jgi:lipoyl(octanoyl) transferase